MSNNVQIKTNFKLNGTVCFKQNIILLSYDLGVKYDMTIFLTCFVRFTLLGRNHNTFMCRSQDLLHLASVHAEMSEVLLSQQVLLFVTGPHLFVLSLSCQAFLMQKMIC